jgi:hypothetical protein
VAAVAQGREPKARTTPSNESRECREQEHAYGAADAQSADRANQSAGSIGARHRDRNAHGRDEVGAAMGV